MKRFLSIVLAIMMIVTASVAVASCGRKKDVIINFVDTDNRDTTCPAYIGDIRDFNLDDHVAHKIGYTFGGWYFDTEFTKPATTEEIQKISKQENIYIYAKWIECDKMLISLHDLSYTIEEVETDDPTTKHIDSHTKGEKDYLDILVNKIATEAEIYFDADISFKKQVIKDKNYVDKIYLRHNTIHTEMWRDEGGEAPVQDLDDMLDINATIKKMIENDFIPDELVNTILSKLIHIEYKNGNVRYIISMTSISDAADALKVYIGAHPVEMYIMNLKDQQLEIPAELIPQKDEAGNDLPLNISEELQGVIGSYKVSLINEIDEFAKDFVKEFDITEISMTLNNANQFIEFNIDAVIHDWDEAKIVSNTNIKAHAAFYVVRTETACATELWFEKTN